MKVFKCRRKAPRRDFKTDKSELENLDIDGKDVFIVHYRIEPSCLMPDINKIISIAKKSILTKTGNSVRHGSTWFY